MKLFVVDHVYNKDSDLNEEIKLIGIFDSMELAKKAIDELKDLDGFRENPDIIEHTSDKEGKGGFIISENELNYKHWDTGFV